MIMCYLKSFKVAFLYLFKALNMTDVEHCFQIALRNDCPNNAPVAYPFYICLICFLMMCKIFT